MDYGKLTGVSTAVIAFATVLGVLFAMIYYFYQILNKDILLIMTLGNAYISVILFFLYYLRKKLK